MLIPDKPKKNEDLQVFTEYEKEEEKREKVLYHLPRIRAGFRLRIPHEELFSLKGRQKNRWYRYDIEEVKEDEEEEEEKSEKQEELDEVDKQSRTPINVKLLSRGRNIKLKAIALNEIKEQMEEDSKEESDENE